MEKTSASSSHNTNTVIVNSIKKARQVIDMVAMGEEKDDEKADELDLDENCTVGVKTNLLHVNGFRMATLNVRDIFFEKQNDLSGLLDYMKVDFVMLQETMKHPNSTFKIDGYTWLGGHGVVSSASRIMKGLGFLVSEKYAGIFSKCSDKELNTTSNVMWVKAELFHKKGYCVFFANIYIPAHSISNTKIDRTFGTITKMLAYIRRNFPDAAIILGGDFNVHVRKLLSRFGAEKQSDYGGRFLVEWSGKLGLLCHNARSPGLNITRTNYKKGRVTSEAIIDYIFCTGIKWSEAFAVDTTGLSDHNMVICDFNMFGKTFPVLPSKQTYRIKVGLLSLRGKRGDTKMKLQRREWKPRMMKFWRNNIDLTYIQGR